MILVYTVDVAVGSARLAMGILFHGSILFLFFYSLSSLDP